MLPLVVKHDIIRATPNPYPKSHVLLFCFPNEDMAENYHVPQNNQPIEEQIGVKEKNVENEDCSPEKIQNHHFHDIVPPLAVYPTSMHCLYVMTGEKLLLLKCGEVDGCSVCD